MSTQVRNVPLLRVVVTQARERYIKPTPIPAFEFEKYSKVPGKKSSKRIKCEKDLEPIPDTFFSATINGLISLIITY